MLLGPVPIAVPDMTPKPPQLDKQQHNINNNQESSQQPNHSACHSEAGAVKRQRPLISSKRSLKLRWLPLAPQSPARWPGPGPCCDKLQLVTGFYGYRDKLSCVHVHTLTRTNTQSLEADALQFLFSHLSMGLKQRLDDLSPVCNENEFNVREDILK